jgi:predicted transcriptional regulator
MSSKSIPAKNPRHRHKIDTISDILLAIRNSEPNGILKFHILCQAEISTSQIENYLPYLIENELIYTTMNINPRQANNKKPTIFYHISKKGRIFIKLYDDDNKMVLDGEGKQEYVI